MRCGAHTIPDAEVPSAQTSPFKARFERGVGGDDLTRPALPSLSEALVISFRPRPTGAPSRERRLLGVDPHQFPSANLSKVSYI